jgi:nitrogen PTS system EIIA component
MLLESSDAAHALHVDEETFLNWIRKDSLPAQRVEGRYQTRAVDLLEWATERGIKVHPALYQMPDADQRPLPTLSQALQAGGIFNGIAGSDKQTVLRTVVENLKLPPEIDPAFILQVLLARESLGTTAVGDGIAIPHVRNPILVQLSAPKVSLSYLARSIDFEALDGKPIHILFTMLSPDLRTHLHLLSQLVFCLGDHRFRRVLGHEFDHEAILSATREIEKELEQAHAHA